MRHKPYPDRDFLNSAAGLYTENNSSNPYETRAIKSLYLYDSKDKSV